MRRALPMTAPRGGSLLIAAAMSVWLFGACEVSLAQATPVDASDVASSAALRDAGAFAALLDQALRRAAAPVGLGRGWLGAPGEVLALGERSANSVLSVGVSLYQRPLLQIHDPRPGGLVQRRFPSSSALVDNTGSLSMGVRRTVGAEAAHLWQGRYEVSPMAVLGSRGVGAWVVGALDMRVTPEDRLLLSDPSRRIDTGILVQAGKGAALRAGIGREWGERDASSLSYTVALIGGTKTMAWDAEMVVTSGAIGGSVQLTRRF